MIPKNQKILIVCGFVLLFLSVMFSGVRAADFNISLTAEFDAGNFTNTTTITHRYNQTGDTLTLSFPYAVKDTDLISYWRFENNMNDEVGYKTLDNNGADYTATGKFDGAYTFDGATEWINATDDYEFYTTGTTYSAWIWFNDMARDDLLFLKYDLDDDDYFGIYFNEVDGLNKGMTFDSSIGSIEETLALSINTWYHIVGTVDTLGNSYHMRMYFNGIERGTSQNSGSIDAAGFDFNIGADPGVELWLDGKIDEFKIYDRTLSDAEILELYNSGLQYKNIGNWTSETQTVPGAGYPGNLTLLYSNLNFSHGLINVDWLNDSNSAILASYTNGSGNTTSGTTLTIYESNLTSGTFLNVTADYRIRIFLIGNGTSTPIISELHGDYIRGCTYIMNNTPGRVLFNATPATLCYQTWNINYNYTVPELGTKATLAVNNLSIILFVISLLLLGAAAKSGNPAAIVIGFVLVIMFFVMGLDLTTPIRTGVDYYHEIINVTETGEWYTLVYDDIINTSEVIYNTTINLTAG